MTPPSPIVGIIANPASGRDLRRLTAHAGLHSSTDKASVVQRLLAAFGATGIRHALLPPDMTGIAAAVLRASQTRQARDGHWPFLEFLDMPLRQSVEDTRLAARRMVERGVALIAVLGGDGTHKAVAAEVGDVPLLALSTGTNNAFPELREAAGAGLAGGLCASNRVPPEIGLRRNKRLLVREPRRGLCEWALVDVAVSPQPFIGARAISRAEDLAEVFVSFAEPHAIGLSALCGLWSPVSREEPHGAWMRLHPDAREPAGAAGAGPAGGLRGLCRRLPATRRGPRAEPVQRDPGAGRRARDRVQHHRPPKHHPRPFRPVQRRCAGHPRLRRPPSPAGRPANPDDPVKTTWRTTRCPL